MNKMRAKMIAVGLLGAAAMGPFDFAKAAQVGHASWYSLPENLTANGEQMNPSELTAAHRSLPFGTKVLVENLSNGRSVVVRINDRGPFTGGRIIDLSKAAAASIGMIDAGVAQVRVTSADGGALAALGESTAKAKDGASSAAAAEADDAAPQPPAKVAVAAPQPSEAKSVSRPASASKKRVASHTKVAAVAKKVSKPASASKTRVASQAAVKTAAVTKRPKPSGSTNARVGVANAANRVRAAGPLASSTSSRRVNLASNTPHLYAVLGTTPGFIKPARTRERRTG